jgi:hypothetical protein
MKIHGWCSSRLEDGQLAQSEDDFMKYAVREVPVSDSKKVSIPMFIGHMGY